MAEQRRERKVVTVVFCDLVGFTQRAEQLDPEDVEALLTPYHERLRSELERHGGTVEKFIGDAVMALFGAPTTHEDDPERAVRACLAIRDWAVEEDDVQVRIAVTTGEALIRLDARPEAGEGMASGDVVNTAARLQNAAPVNGILADETTYRATRQVIDYREVSAVEAKGKAEPIPVWEALAAHARFGVDVAHEARTELVGRKRELNIVRDAFERVRHERTPQLLTLVGVPGMGKSRLVYELSQIVDADPELVTWRQGRCLAYGDGVTLWALGEIVKAQAGILEQDAPDEVAAKISSAVRDALSGTGDETWVESHLLALVGLADEAELGGDRRSEAFAAWRRFLEALAEQRPLVLVFEDLHWADESLLDFVDELVDWITDVPLLVVATARPELLERRPGWGGGKLNATTLALSALSNEQTALLLGQLLGRPVLAVESQQVLLERAGGNPLYAEQFAELFLERGSADELPLPETLQGIIAARLDGLSHDEKELLRDAAVVGKVFWASALRREQGNAAATLHSLERKGLVRRQKRTSVEGESEFAFAHALVRDVAYGQIARADRAEKHRQTAEWMDSLGRPEDHAEMLAHHWNAALELSRATGADASDFSERARFALREAGDRAFALNAFVSAERYYADALALWPNHDPERAELLFRRARSLYEAGDDRRELALEEARDLLLAAGDREAAGETESFLADVLWFRGQRDLADGHLAGAEELVSDAAPSMAKARVLAFSARLRMLAGESADAIRLGRAALELAEELSLDELRAHALNSIAAATFSSGDWTRGGEIMQEALAIAVEANSREAWSILNNLGFQATLKGELASARGLFDEVQGLAERFGDATAARFMRANVAETDLELGRWDEAASAADELIAQFEISPHYSESGVRQTRAAIRLARGVLDGALEDAELALARAREIKDNQVLLPTLILSAMVSAFAGREREARACADEAIEIARHSVLGVSTLGRLTPFADRLGVRREIREILESVTTDSPWKEAAVAGADGDLSRAASIYEGMGARTLAAGAGLAAAESLIESGRQSEGEAELQRALAFYRSVGATFFIRRGEELLVKSA